MSLFTDLKDVFTAYAQRIKGLAAADEEIKADLDTQDAYTILLNDNVPNTTQAYTFTDGKVSQITHNRNSVAIRTDVFTYGTGTITEKRTLNTGESVTLVTNLTTLETAVEYDGGNE